MGHITSKNAYKSLEERINWFTQGAPASETFYKILQVLFTEKEAKVMAMLPVSPIHREAGCKDLEYFRGKGGKGSGSSV